jgi:hypothetical protein
MFSRRKKNVYTWVAKGQIMYRLYVIFNRENIVYRHVSSKVNHVSNFMGGYRSVQDDM